MKTAVVNLMKCSPNSIIASNRIAIYLAYKLGCPLIDSRESCHGTYDRVYVVNGPMLYCSFRPELQALVVRAKEVSWIENDYAITMPKFIKIREPIVLSACENFRKHLNHAYVNWNQLTYFSDVPEKKVKVDALFYYGAFRPGRRLDFEKYLRSDLYPVHISAGIGARKKFREVIPHAHYLDAGNLMTMLSAYSSTIYIEDVKSHKIYTSPANRFYEALSAHTLQLFDKATVGTFEKAGIDVTPWVVDSPREVAERYRDEKLRKHQLTTLRAVDYRNRLDSELKAALEKFN